jgi:hypothetical protein
MKKTLTIILLSISLSGFSQTEKRDFVITPTVGWNTIGYSYEPDRYEQFHFGLSTGFHKYLSDRFAIGLVNYVSYDYTQPYFTTQFYRSAFRIGIIPEVRYNFLKTRLTPFVAGRIFDIGYINTFYDNPATPIYLRRIKQLNLINSLQIDLGLSYFIKDRFGLQVKLMDLNVGLFNRTDFKAYLPINFGLQFIINNPRSEIESPR